MIGRLEADRLWPTAMVVLAVVAIVSGLYAAWASGPAGSAPEPSRIQAVRDFQELAAVAPQRALRECRPSEPNMFTALAAQLADDEISFHDERFEYRRNGLIYLSASTLDDEDDIAAPAPVWVYGSGGFAPLGRAATASSVKTPNAQTAYGADPFGEAATRVKTCVLAAERVEDGR